MKTIKCHKCGAEIPKDSIICPNCKERCLSSRKNKTATILAFCCGFLGMHNLYLGYLDRSGLECGISALGILFIIWGLVQEYSVFWICGIVMIGLVMLTGMVEGILLIRKVINRDGQGKRLR